jgi:hypothetical protein
MCNHAPFNRIEALPMFVRMLQRLEFNCVHQINDCPIFVPYDDYAQLLEHERICDYKMVACSGCEFPLLLGKLKEHENLCQEVKIACAACGNGVKRKDESTHEDTCPDVLVVCPKCNERVKRKIKHGTMDCLQFKAKVKLTSMFSGIFGNKS